MPHSLALLRLLSRSSSVRQLRIKNKTRKKTMKRRNKRSSKRVRKIISKMQSQPYY